MENYIKLTEMALYSLLDEIQVSGRPDVPNGCVKMLHTYTLLKAKSSL